MNSAFFLQTIVLCLSVSVRGYDDPNFDLPSVGLSLHLQCCEMVSASLWALVKHGAPRKSIPPELLDKLQDGWHGTASEPRSISDERRWRSFVAPYPCWILDRSLVVQSRIPRHARNGSVLFTAWADRNCETSV
jgi:hypothetical protein